MDLKNLQIYDNPAELLKSLRLNKSLKNNGRRFVVATIQKAGFNKNQARDDNGRWVKGADVREAAHDPVKADALRARVTDPAERRKLDRAIVDAGNGSLAESVGSYQPANVHPSAYFNDHRADMLVNSAYVYDMGNDQQFSGKKHDPIAVKIRDGELITNAGLSRAAMAAGIGQLPVKIVDNNPKEWFRAEELDKSLKVSSAQQSYEEHYDAANENMDTSEDSLRAVLNLGKGLSASIGGEVVDFGQAIEKSALDSHKPLILFGPVKTEESATRKVRDKYSGDFTKLGDVIRASVIVDRFDKVGPVLAILRKDAEKRGWKVAPGSGDNKFDKPTKAGYRDVSLSLVAPNGQLAEIQVHAGAMFNAKETKGHKLYEQWRVLDARAAKNVATAEELAELKRLEKEQYDLYSAANKKIGGK